MHSTLWEYCTAICTQAQSQCRPDKAVIHSFVSTDKTLLIIIFLLLQAATGGPRLDAAHPNRKHFSLCTRWIHLNEKHWVCFLFPSLKNLRRTAQHFGMNENENLKQKMHIQQHLGAKMTQNPRRYGFSDSWASNRSKSRLISLLEESQGQCQRSCNIHAVYICSKPSSCLPSLAPGNPLSNSPAHKQHWKDVG